MAVTAEQIQQVRWEVQDVDAGLPILPDETYVYLIEKNNGSIRRSSLDAARMILFKLSIDSSDQTVDIFSIKGSKAAQQYMQALKLFLKDSNLNPALTMAEGYAGGVSKEDMISNLANPDNNAFVSPSYNPDSLYTQYDPFRPY